jgi:hypothetical protein
VPEDFATLLSGQIDVQKDYRWARRLIIDVRFIEEHDGLLAVSGDVHIYIEIGGFDRTADKERIRRGVFDNQDEAALARGLVSRGA